MPIFCAFIVGLSLFSTAALAQESAEDPINYPLQRSLRFSEEPAEQGAEPEATSRDSQAVRAEKTWYFGLGLGHGSLGPYLDPPDFRLEVFYDARRYETKTDTPRTDEYLGLQLRHFVSNSVFLGYGLGVFRRQQVLRYRLYHNPITEDVIYQFAYADSKGSFLSLRLGNEWHWERWLVAIDWLRINWTLTQSTRIEDSPHNQLPRDERHWVTINWLGFVVGVSL
jgi:hypothetical protein